MPIFNLTRTNKPPIDFHKFVIDVLKILSKKGYFFKQKNKMEYIDWVKENPNEFAYNAMIDGTRSITLTNAALKVVGNVGGFVGTSAANAKDIKDNLQIKQAVDRDLDSISFLKQKEFLDLFPHYKYSGNRKWIFTVEYSYTSIGVYIVFKCRDKDSIQSNIVKERCITTNHGSTIIQLI